jgi:hypothetical protein
MARESFPSERSALKIPKDCKTAEEGIRTLRVLGSTLRSKADAFVDASLIPEPDEKAGISRRAGMTEFFPDKLHLMLETVEREGLTDIVSFLPHGRAFRVHDRDRFVSEILPRFFESQKKWSSFGRQLNMYGFSRSSSEPDAGAYYHELFLRGRPSLCRYMRRAGAPHGPDRRKCKLAEGDDPDFYAMKPMTVKARQQHAENVA